MGTRRGKTKWRDVEEKGRAAAAAARVFSLFFSLGEEQKKTTVHKFNMCKLNLTNFLKVCDSLKEMHRCKQASKFTYIVADIKAQITYSKGQLRL